MKKFYNNTLIGGAFSKALRVIALLCVLLGVSSSAWAWDNELIIWNGADNNKYYYDISNGSCTVNLSSAGDYYFFIKDNKDNGKEKKLSGYSQMTNGNSTEWRFDGTNSNCGLKVNNGETGNFTFKLRWDNSTPIVSVIYPTSSGGGGGSSTTYHAKYPWDGGNNWYFKDFDANNQITGKFYADGMDIGTSEGSTTYYIIIKNGTLSNGTPCTFTWNPTAKTVTATPTGGGGGGESGDDVDGCTTVYLNENNLWDYDNARLYVYYWNANGSVWKQLIKSKSCGDDIFYASIPDNASGYMFVRLDNTNSSPNFDNAWHKTGDLTLSNKHQYKLTSIPYQGQQQTDGEYETVGCNEVDTNCQGSGGGGGEGGDTEEALCDLIEVWCSKTNMNCYAWDSNNTPLIGNWPGSKSTTTETKDGVTYAIWKFTNQDVVNVIFNDGGSGKTADITALRKGIRYIVTLKDDWNYEMPTEQIDCSLPKTNVLLAREAKVDVVAKTATVYGYLQSTLCNDITDYGFYYCTTGDGGSQCTPVANDDYKWPASSTESLPRGKEFEAAVDKLEDGTTYYYRAYAVINGEPVLSQEVRSITTEPCKAQKAWGDPVIYTVDARFTVDNTCKLHFRDVQKAIDHLKGSYVNDYDYQYVAKEDGSFNLNQPVVIKVRYYDDDLADTKKAYTYRGTTNYGMTAGDVAPVNVNLIQDFNKNATNRANTLTIKAGDNVAKPWVHHIVVRNSRNIVLDSLCIYSDPTGLADNAMEFDLNSTWWDGIGGPNAKDGSNGSSRYIPILEDANILVQNCMIGSAGFTGVHFSGYDGITFKNNDFEAQYSQAESDDTSYRTVINYGASAKFISCKNIKFIQNNFRGSHPTLMWLQECSNVLVMNNVFWNTNTLQPSNTNLQRSAALRLVHQFNNQGKPNVSNVSAFYNTFYLAESENTKDNARYDFLYFSNTVDNGSGSSSSNFDLATIKFQYNNCYSYDKKVLGKSDGTRYLCNNDKGTCANVNEPFLGLDLSESDNFCPNNFWSEYDQNKGNTTSAFAFGCSDNTFTNVKTQVCETTASGPASLIVRGSDMNLGSAPNVSSTGIKLEADEVLADRYLVGVRPKGVGWTYGAYQTRAAKDVDKIYWVGVTDNWDDRNNWEFEVKNNDKIVRQRVSCVENLSKDLHVIIEEIGTVEVADGRKWPRLPESFDQKARFQESGIPVAEQVNAGNTNKFADHIELEYGAGIIGVENLKNGELHYTRASNKLISPRSEWILVGPTIKPFDEKTPSTDDVREVVSGDYFIKNHEPHVYMHKAKFLEDGIGWDATFADLSTPLTANTVYAMQIPDQYGDFKLPAELYYTYVVPNAEKQKDAIVSKEFSFEGRFYNEDALPKYTGLTKGQPVLISNTYPANINVDKLKTHGTVSVYDYNKKSFDPIVAKAATPILSQHGFVFTPANDDGYLEIPQDYFLHSITRRSAEVQDPYCRISAKNLDTNTSSEIALEVDELKDDVANYLTDAPKAFNTMEASLPDVYIIRYEKKWAGLKVPTMSEAIPLGVHIAKEGTRVRFSLVASEDMGDIILEDRVEGKTYNLTIGQVCDVEDLPIGYCEGRFFLNLSEISDEEDEEIGGDVSTEVEEILDNSGISIIGNSNGVVVSCSLDLELQTVYINDMSGKTAAFRVSGQYANIDLPVAKGVYTVNVIADKASKTGKVILK